MKFERMDTIRSTLVLVLFLFGSYYLRVSSCFIPSSEKKIAFLPRTTAAPSCNKATALTSKSPGSRLFMSSFSADGDDYSSKDSYEDEEEPDYKPSGEDGMEDEDEDPATELQPVPMSKNSGSRFVAIFWDRELDTKNRDALDRHEDRIALTEDHVMFCRKRNLYNETFNTDSMVDILWSRQLLSSDLKRTIGHAICMESTKLHYVQEMLAEEPLTQMLTGGDLSKIPLYRWRHIRDHTLRQDDGRFGCPCMCIAMDHKDDDNHARADIGNAERDTLEYLIRSERVIAAGPLHLLTEYKDDPSSIAVGDLIMFNAKDREAAIDYAEGLPTAKLGLYDDLRVYFYNNLDLTGKFVSEDPSRDSPCDQMKDALEYWGYPTGDDQTPWLNW